MANKATVTFIDTSKECKKVMADLSKTALRESGKVVRKLLRSEIPLRSKRFKNHVATWVFIDYKTGQPQMQVGFYSWQRVKKRGKLPSHASPYWIERGTKGHLITSSRGMAYNGIFYGRSVNHPGQKPTNVLRDTVYNNVDKIKAAQTETLALLNKTLEAAGAKVYNGEEVEDD